MAFWTFIKIKCTRRLTGSARYRAIAYAEDVIEVPFHSLQFSAGRIR